MARQKRKQTKKANKDNKSPNNYQPAYLIIGLVMLFISIVALFKWGFIGTFITNVMRLLVGEAYDLIFTLTLVIGIYMILRGRVMQIHWREAIGILLILFAITTLLHINVFLPQEPLSQSIYAETFAIFRNELLMNQTQTSLGGGLLGAVFYASFGYLFGRWGTYLLVFILFFAGLFLLVGITGQALSQSFMQIIKSIYGLFSNSVPDYEELKSIVQQERLSTDAEREANKNSEEYTEVKVTNSKKSSSQANLFTRIRDKVTGVPNKSTLSGTHETAYKPIIHVDSQREWAPYKENVPLASTAAHERENKEHERILDLDYFDQMHEGKKHNNTVHPAKYSVALEKEEKEDKQPLSRVTESIELPLDQLEESNKNTVASPSTSESEQDKDMTVTDEQNIESSETALNFNSLDTPHSSSDMAASHWQDQANITQDLTEDELEQRLNSSNQEATKTTKNVKKKTKKGYKKYQLPSKELLTKIPPVDQTAEYQRINENIDKLERTFESFGVDAKVVKANLGPAVTKYEIEPAVGVKVSKIVSLSDDIALALAARDVRIEAPIPGKSLIGIEVPNTQVSPVSFLEVIDPALDSSNLLDVPLGRDVSGSVCLADLTKMPHLLIAGATGSGKSVGMNVIICSLLMKAKPEEVKLLMIDPKKVELTLYNDLPHLLSPVVTNPRKAAKALNNVVEEMERRYELFASLGVRNVDGYNDYIDEINKEDGTGYEKLPKIVVLIDELADLMLVASNEVENAIIRLAQMARAAGIHMIIATQRPSVDVITGIIKANIPSRLAFAVSSGTDSRTILDGVGAEKLLGKGDMLFQPMGRNKPIRVQGAYISDNEVERITDFIKDQREADYDESIVVTEESMEMANASDDEYFEDAIDLIKEQETVSISQLQRRFRIGYNRAARLIDDLEAVGYVSEQDGSKPRTVLINE